MMEKRILIAGAGSYIGTSIDKWLSKTPEKYVTDTIDMTDGSWRDKSFTGYDTVIHVAGIAHADTGKASEETRALYYKVNCDLAVETAEKAKSDGIKHFIFMSSIIVYGSHNPVITKDTLPNPDNFYGDSKLQADNKLMALDDSAFRVAIIRSPMVYGNGSKGNFPRLVGLTNKLPFFPDYPNQRSMIYIENLCAYIESIIDKNSSGVHFPQNEDYVNTTALVRQIAAAYGKNMRTTRLFNPIISLTKKHISPVGKLFGDLVYAMAGDESEYNVVGFEESIGRSVIGN